MMKTKNTKGFTLVELIIVITILAILATIAFVSFQSYTKDARNSKRTNDLASITRAIEVKMAEGVSIMNFASGNTSKVTGIDLAGVADYAGAEYNAGELNTTIIGATNNNSFLDPLKKVGYKIGVTSLAGGAYQIAAINEVENTQQAMVVGTFKQRLTTTLGTGTLSSSDKVITLTAGQGTLKKGDTIVGSSTNTGVITSISSDLATITVDTDLDAGSTQFHVAVSESAGLIASASSGSVAVADKGESYLPY